MVQMHLKSLTWPTLGAVLRVVVDLAAVGLAFIAAFGIRFVGVVLWTKEVSSDQLPSLLESYVVTFGILVLPLMVTVVGAMAASGVYDTRRRPGTQLRRLLLVAQGMSLGFLVFGFLSFYLGTGLLFPRAVFSIAWALSLFAILVSRMGATVFSGIRVEETREQRQNARSVARHVLVIGGGGYIGPPLISRLLEDGCRVRVLDLQLYGTEPVAHLLPHSRFELVRGDFRDIEVVIRAMQDVDAVVHLGGLVGDPACAIDEHLTLEINVAATRMIAEAARGLGVRRFVFASSCSVYGASDGILTEESPLNPVSLYARSKIEGERVLLEMASEHFSPIVLRFATIYGLAPRPRFDLVVNLFAAKACIDRNIEVFGGEQWRPFVHVSDVGEAIRLSLFSPLSVTGGQVFNVGSNKLNFTISQVADIVAKLVPGTTVVMNGQDVDRRDYRVSFERISTELGFQPKLTIEDGILEVVDAIRSGRIGDYRHPRYSNLLSLKGEDVWRQARRTA